MTHNPVHVLFSGMVQSAPPYLGCTRKQYKVKQNFLPFLSMLSYRQVFLKIVVQQLFVMCETIDRVWWSLILVFLCEALKPWKTEGYYTWWESCNSSSHIFAHLFGTMDFNPLFREKFSFFQIEQEFVESCRSSTSCRCSTSCRSSAMRLKVPTDHWMSQ